jgi:hypothetical protein
MLLSVVAILSVDEYLRSCVVPDVRFRAAAKTQGDASRQSDLIRFKNIKQTRKYLDYVYYYYSTVILCT